jgi:hypothetical protein
MTTRRALIRKFLSQLSITCWRWYDRWKKTGKL